MGTASKRSSELRFFGWDTPIIPAAAARLAAEFGAAPGLNLSSCTVVLPGQRSGRALLAALSRVAEDRNTVLIPPTIVTPGRLPELLYAADRPEISELEAELLWVSILRSDLERLSPLFPGAEPTERFTRWLGLARQMVKLRSELGATGRVIPELLRGEFVDRYAFSAERWELLADLMEEFEVRLDDLGVTDRHRARASALESGVFTPLSGCVLIGTLDLPPVVKEILARSGTTFESWVQAPEAAAAGFDRFGAVVPEFWGARPLVIKEEAISFGRNPINQAEECARIVASWAKEASADEIAVAVPDEEIVPHIEEVLGDYELPVRAAGGVPRSKIAPVFVLSLLAKFLGTGSLQDLGSLLRHPDISRWLSRDPEGKKIQDGELLGAFDRYQRYALPLRIDGDLPGAARVRDKVRVASAAVQKLYDCSRHEERPLSSWCGEMRRVLLSLYGDRALRRGINAEKLTLETLELLDAEIREIERLPRELAPEVGFAEALALLVQRAGSERVEPNTFESAIELTGWLELYLDERPYVIVTACNEGFLPESANEDPFLPNAARREIGLTDNALRYARDAAVLSALLHGRKDVRLIVGGVGSLGDIRPPSRLLLSDPSTLGARVSRFYGAFEREPAGASPRGAMGSRKLLPIEPTGLAGSITRVRVTAISAYLDCKYRFFLRYIEKLEDLRDDWKEMSALDFGTFGHEPLARFAEDSGLSALTDPGKIERVLSELLDLSARERFGGSPLPAVKLQIEQLRYRYKIFSEWQARWAEQGWRIEFAERDFEGTLQTGKGPLTLTARIDRVDRHKSTGERAVFDYKFGDDGDQFYDKLKKRGGLQLALYGTLLEQAGIGAVRNFGIIPLTGAALTDGQILGAIDSQALPEFLEEARIAAEGILAGEFWPPSSKSHPGDPFRGICGVGVEEEDEVSETQAEGADV